ncbi:MAG TPA: glutamate-5-semialdehyde dehydrogenase [Candidatus Omnitrophota bacterium]|nr:glutamate-5-semialdehyde dehydrogenase [Candidatus Omnitrophota bacterium]HQL40746.1 glutamate-5-semialdehyde dehydrogenase [Candidatus Omnitrophota bacterium]
MKFEKNISAIAQRAKKASRSLALISTQEKNKALLLMAHALIARKNFLLRENKKDVDAARANGYSAALIDRLTLNLKRVEAMAACLQDTARLQDPVGQVLRVFKRPNGLVIRKVRTSIGVIGVIYESRPNVTSDCAGLCLKSGNAVILRGGKEAIFSNRAIFKVLRIALRKTKISVDAIQFIDVTDRGALDVLLRQDQHIDLVIPRGGEGLIRFVVENSYIPVVKHYKGVCHVYVGASADLAMARKICLNAKVQRPGVCNAMETLLVDERIARKFLPGMISEFIDAGVEVRGCPKTRQICAAKIGKATDKDWFEEYLDLILAVKVVKGAQEAIEHINYYGTKHSDAIITRNKSEAKHFLRSVDSACVYVNASTRFTDGYEFGFGAEIGISTDKLHARGPMALEELTTYKYEILGNGQVRS